MSAPENRASALKKAKSTQLLQFVTGAVVMAIVGLFADGSARPMLAGIAGCAVVALALSWVASGNAATRADHRHP